MEQAAAAILDSIAARLAGSAGTVHEENGRVHLDLGSGQGIRSWSTVTLTGSFGAWSGTVALLETSRAILVSALAGQTTPPDGSTVLVRLELRRLALYPLEAPPELRVPALLLEEALQDSAPTRAGLDLLSTPDFPEGNEARAVAADRGADLLARIRLSTEGGSTAATVVLEPLLREDRVLEPLTVTVGPLPGGELSGDTIRAPLPGCRFDVVRDSIPGAVLDLYRNRYRPGEIMAFFPDRLESWLFEPGTVERTSLVDLDRVWPQKFNTRWPVGTVVPVTSLYGRDREEEKVLYAACSNTRPKFLTIETLRAHPDSLRLTVSREPEDSLSASFESCFARADRVSRPKEYRLPVGMPRSAIARLALSSVVIGPSGVPARDPSGRPRTDRVAVVYHDEATATLWISMADTAWQVPGLFGSEMDTYRAGHGGPPALLITAAAGPGEPDHLELWTLEKRELHRAWRSAEFAGSLSALAAADLDGDHRDDLVVAEVRRAQESGREASFLTRLLVMKSRPGPGSGAW